MKQIPFGSVLLPRFSALFACGLFIVSACNVERTGGNSDGAGGVGGESPIDCPGVSVVLSDYVSTQIALGAMDGTIQVESLLSTASTQTDGLAFALSGDVSLPGSPTRSGEVVLLDRYGTNVITWVDPQSGVVLAQLPVGTGFESNPQDYLEVDEETAWVSRWGQNTAPGSEDYDDGGDILLLDLDEHSIKESIVIPPEDDLPARPGPLSQVDNELFVTLDRIALDFSSTGEAQLLSFDTKTGKRNFKQTLKGRKACGRLTPSPDGRVLAIACTGALTSDGEVESLSQSAVMLFDAEERPLKVTATFEAEDLLGEPLQAALTFVDKETVLLKTQTSWGGKTDNRLFSLNLSTNETHVLLEAAPDDDGLGKGLVFTGIACAPGCADTCLMADGDQKKLQVIGWVDQNLEVIDSVKVEKKVGLPPTGLSRR